jgi:hypothetical protein
MLRRFFSSAKHTIDPKVFSMSNFNVHKYHAGDGSVIMDIFPKGVDESDSTKMAASVCYDPKTDKGIGFSTWDQYKNPMFESNLLEYAQGDNGGTGITWDHYVVNVLGQHPGFESMFEREKATRIQRKKHDQVETSYIV